MENQTLKHSTILSPSDQSLYDAILKNDIASCKRLLAGGANPNAKTGYPGISVLHTAVWRRRVENNMEVIALLVGAGADVNSADESGNAPLHVAAGWDLAETCRFLVAQGANLNAQCNAGDTALHRACAGQNLTKACRVLIESGADVNATNVWGRRPLHVAAQYDMREACQLLLAHGADRTSTVETSAKSIQMNAFQTAVYYGAVNVVSYFVLECDENPHQNTVEGHSMLELDPDNQVMQALLRSLQMEWSVKNAIDATAADRSAVASGRPAGMAPL